MTSPVLAALALLPAEQRRVVVLHHVLGLPAEELARALSRPAVVVRRELASGTAALARLLRC